MGRLNRLLPLRVEASYPHTVEPESGVAWLLGDDFPPGHRGKAH